MHLVPPAQGVGLGDGFGEGHRQARRGHHQQQIVDHIGVVEVAEALVPQDIAQRDLVDGSDELDDGDARRQNGGAAEEGAFLFSITQWAHSLSHGLWGAARTQPNSSGRAHPSTSFFTRSMSMVRNSPFLYMTLPRAIFITTLEPWAA